jgi:hypothetical protein
MDGGESLQHRRVISLSRRPPPSRLILSATRAHTCGAPQDKTLPTTRGTLRKKGATGSIWADAPKTTVHGKNELVGLRQSHGDNQASHRTTAAGRRRRRLQKASDNRSEPAGSRRAVQGGGANRPLAGGSLRRASAQRRPQGRRASPHPRNQGVGAAAPPRAGAARPKNRHQAARAPAQSHTPQQNPSPAEAGDRRAGGAGEHVCAHAVNGCCSSWAAPCAAGQTGAPPSRRQMACGKGRTRLSRTRSRRAFRRAAA